MGQVVEGDDGTGNKNQDVKSSSGEIPTLGSASVVLDNERWSELKKGKKSN